MFAWIKSLFVSDLNSLEKRVIFLMKEDGYVTKDSFYELTGMKLYWLQKCRETMTEKWYTVHQHRYTTELHPGHLGGCQVRWYFTK